MKLGIPWIVSRRSVLIAATLDFFICLFLYEFVYQYEYNSEPSRLVSNTFAFFWIVVSYVLGRYEKTRRISFVIISKIVIKSIFLLFLTNTIYLFINWGYPLLFFWNDVNFFNTDLKDLSNFFIRVSIYIVIVSTLLQFNLGIINKNIYNQNKVWIFYGTSNKYKEIMNETSMNRKSIFWLSNEDNLVSLDINNIQGIIIEDFSIINQENIDLIFKLKLKGIIIDDLLSWFEKQFHRMPTNLIENKYQLLEKLKSTEDKYQRRIKRIGDIIVSIFILLATFPITLITCISIFIEDQGPIFYSQVRTGHKGERIKIYKFRSMVINAEEFGAQWSSAEDKRITKVGKIIRATRLDELPQLFSVIKGQMSLIGPRPERPEIEERILKEIPFYNYRNVLKPGISGWAQVNYPYGSSIRDTTNKLSYDIYYINHISFLLDILILFKTIKTVFTARGDKRNDLKNLR